MKFRTDFQIRFKAGSLPTDDRLIPEDFYKLDLFTWTGDAEFSKRLTIRLSSLEGNEDVDSQNHEVELNRTEVKALYEWLRFVHANMAEDSSLNSSADCNCDEEDLMKYSPGLRVSTQM
ncbi:hypothetical protein KIH39_04480 [Telmatocola sphagniphila]|uniref:Uncharacterized protein n=1 Tax=Telmatocola sphagniphila TaxID=1123043 RepID=A0A8E6B6T9_9BACT|nr:hypothetical protein [Telmatocola sphagniphila]QVL33180.1 hypothetical protein KIH39_04480 [Telmatocola sphagniphila]